ncbi:unnamed protein product [Rotaria sordida]|nr:unnamed protein product [Rotaria sordida]CAF3947508.1 unnamed protein product [Rotaria sordida]
MNNGRWAHTASVLPNGEVLVTGGYNGTTLNSAELYNPSTGTWTVINIMNNPRSSHTAFVLTNGKMLIAGGIDNMPLNSAELY